MNAPADMPVDVLTIAVGRTYEAKKPGMCGYPPQVNDRQVLWIEGGGAFVQYDGPAVANGRQYPKVRMEKFLAWAGRDVTDEMPPGNWRTALANCKPEGGK